MSIYNKNDGLKYVMEQRWEDKQNDQFPNSNEEYIEKFRQIEDYLNQKYHPDVNLGAAISGDGLLTDHGVAHIKMVMEKANSILGAKVDELKGYEIFLLLVAIHFHDLGNITGRQDHEKKILDVMNDMKDVLPLDIPEQEIVSSIATAHGGFVDKTSCDKDTLKPIQRETFCNGISVRPLLLASILRFADELSDDFSRSRSKVEIPDENKIYHEYSKSLEPLGFNGNTIVFIYRIPYSMVKVKLKKGDKEIYLYDEIMNRLSKCLRELEYCRKYADGFIGITTMSVTIKISDPNNPIKVCDSDSFRVSLSGYPDERTFKLENYIVDNDCLDNRKRLKYSDGEALKKAIEERS